MTELDTKQFGGKLADAITNYHRIVVEAADALTAVEGAQADLREAKDRDAAEAVSAKVKGLAEPATNFANDAELALRAATFDAQVAQQSVRVALDAVVDEAGEPRVKKALDKRVTDLPTAALAALSALDGLLVDLQAAKAHRTWLASPIRGERLAPVIGYDAWVMSEGFRKPSGEPGEAQDLTRAVRDAVTESDRKPTNPAAEYGLPAGVPLVGPWGLAETAPGYMTGGAARAFAEQLPDAEEAQTVLAGD